MGFNGFKIVNVHEGAMISPSSARLRVVFQELARCGDSTVSIPYTHCLATPAPGPDPLQTTCTCPTVPLAAPCPSPVCVCPSLSITIQVSRPHLRPSHFFLSPPLQGSISALSLIYRLSAASILRKTHRPHVTTLVTPLLDRCLTA